METALVKATLEHSLGTSCQGVHVFDVIDSTSSEALRLCKRGAKGIHLVLAFSQTAGRGRRERKWVSPEEAGVYLSLLHPLSVQPQSLQGLSLASALSVEVALRRLGAQGLQVKWPNDVLHNGRKLAGILLELHCQEDAVYVVFGIGINLSLTERQQREINKPVTDLSTLLEKSVSIEKVTEAVVSQLIQYVARFQQQGFAPFYEEWNNLDCYRGQEIELTSGDDRRIGKSLGVDHQGRLLLQTASGEETITGGEIFPSLHEA